MRKYLFIDRDGTLVAEPGDCQIDSLAKVCFEPGVIPALLELQQAGYHLVMVSNQDGLGTASFPLETFTPAHELIVGTLESQGVCFEQILICPHFPADHCRCRKPATGLLDAYLRDPDFERSASYVIGDRQSDLELARNLGIQGLKYSREELPWREIARQLTHLPRRATVHRRTSETDITLSVDLDGPLAGGISTGIGFFDHMLAQIATHGGIGLTVKATGDLEVDEHHTVEDTALALGQALREALGEKRGIGRFGFVLPMDELCAAVWAAPEHLDEPDEARVVLDISGRAACVFEAPAQFSSPQVGALSTQMVPHFFGSLASELRLTLHIKVGSGNAHHQVEALFKAFGRALRQALHAEGHELPSSKGSL